MNQLKTIPLINLDPYFNIWSCADNLYDDETRHWTGECNSMVGMIKYEGKAYRFMGKSCPYGRFYYCEPDVIPQTEVKVYPTRTVYTFENDDLVLTVTFVSPLIADDLLLLARPVAYIKYDIEVKGNRDIDTQIYFDISSECCVDEPTQQVFIYKGDMGMYMGETEQNIFVKAHDDLRIDYGFLHLAEKDAFCGNALAARDIFARDKEYEKCGYFKEYKENVPYSVFTDNPVLAVIRTEKSGIITVAYDDIKAIEYFARPLDCYYKSNGDSFDDMLKKAIAEKEAVIERCVAFDNEYIERAKKISDDYADICSMTYRQAFAAHKLCYNDEGVLFISKECGSNGCAATADITYPSMPLFYIYNIELVKGMLRPIFDYAKTKEWKYDFAPHDVGIYPKLNGQQYGYKYCLGAFDDNLHMPVEECGNMIICSYAVCKKEGNNSFAESNKELLTKWAEYLKEYGMDPGDQLCTDDFNGHLNHNCNLSIKCIIGLYCYGELFNDESYKQKAREYAAEWEKLASEGDHYKLSFDLTDSWSIKYNIIWDKIWNFGLFSDEVFEKECKYYSTKMKKYGLPLDYRSDIGKLDWLMWSAAMTDDKQYRNQVIESICNMINETRQRVPLTDYYNVATGEQEVYGYYKAPIGFNNRTVVGGLAILMM